MQPINLKSNVSEFLAAQNIEHFILHCQFNLKPLTFFFSGVIQHGNEFYFATQQLVRNIVDSKVLTVAQQPATYRPEQILVSHLGEYLVQINGVLYPIIVEENNIKIFVVWITKSSVSMLANKSHSFIYTVSMCKFQYCVCFFFFCSSLLCV